MVLLNCRLTDVKPGNLPRSSSAPVHELFLDGSEDNFKLFFRCIHEEVLAVFGAPRHWLTCLPVRPEEVQGFVDGVEDSFVVDVVGFR